MAHRASTLLRFTALAAALALAACGGGGDAGNLAGLDNQLVGNDADPALTSALADQILVDPTLANQSNKNAVRPPETPTQAQYPPTQGGGQKAGGKAAAGTGAAGSTDAQHAQLASAARGEGSFVCGNLRFDHNLAWARRLPPTFPAYPGARVTEAAGSNEGECKMRVVSFTAAAGYQQLLDWYHTRAVRAGYSSEHQVRGGDHILAGTNARDGGAFYLIVTPKGGGSEAALIANNGY
jgi:hypothetical protein